MLTPGALVRRLNNSVSQIAKVLMAVAILLQSGSVSAQGFGQTTGTLGGTVTDASGSPLPGVLIRADGPEGTRNATTDSNGKFIFPYLTPGDYAVRAELPGFTTVEQNNVDIGVGRRIDITFRMMASVHEIVTVVDEPPLIDPTSTRSEERRVG